MKPGPADKVGVKAGDVILAVNGRSVKSADEVREILHDLKPGDTMNFSLKRMPEGNTLQKSVELEVYPDNL